MKKKNVYPCMFWICPLSIEKIYKKNLAPFYTCLFFVNIYTSIHSYMTKQGFLKLFKYKVECILRHKNYKVTSSCHGKVNEFREFVERASGNIHYTLFTDPLPRREKKTFISFLSFKLRTPFSRNKVFSRVNMTTKYFQHFWRFFLII